MTERLSEREGVPRTEHPYGVPYGNKAYNSKQWRCRCDWCKKSKANDYQIRKGREPKFVIPRAPGEAPPRPPGVVWIDPSGITTVVRCERCKKNYGPWLYDESGAKAFQESHLATHYADPPFDWSAYDAERIMKHPGGRPPLEDRPLCSREDCTEDSRSLGLCAAHYKAHQRAVARAQAEAVERQEAYEERLRNPPKRVRS